MVTCLQSHASYLLQFYWIYLFINLILISRLYFLHWRFNRDFILQYYHLIIMFQCTLPSILCKTQHLAKMGHHYQTTYLEEILKLPHCLKYFLKLEFSIVNKKLEYSRIIGSTNILFQALPHRHEYKSEILLLINPSFLKEGRIIFSNGPRNSPINYSKA